MDRKMHKTWAIGCALATIAGGSAVASHQAAGSESQASGNGTVTFNFVKTADWGSGYNARIDIGHQPAQQRQQASIAATVCQ